MAVSGLEECSVYLDDVVIYSDSSDVHVQRIRALFDFLAEARLTVNQAKRVFAKATVTYLGRVVGQGQMCPVCEKVLPVEKYAPSITKRDSMRFLGLIGY